MSKGKNIVNIRQIAVSCAHCIAMTLLIGAISWLLMVALPNWGALDPLSQSFDRFSFTDLYYSLYRNNDNAVPNDRIVIVDTSDKTRGEIASTIDRLMSCEPIIVGLDIIFDRPTGDTLGTLQLRETLARHNKNIVAIAKLTRYNEEAMQFEGITPSILDDVLPQRAYSNLKNVGEGGFVRNYTIARNVVGDTLYSFASALASHYRGAFGGNTTPHTTEDGIIDFMPQRFNIIDADSLTAHEDEITGRIVLVGNVNSEEDHHYTPIGNMNGSIIHAYSIDTLLDKPTQTVAKGWVALLEILVLWCFVMVYWGISRFCDTRSYKTLLAIVNWIYPVATALLVVCVSGWIFISSHRYMSPLVLMAAMALLPNTVELYIVLKETLPEKIKSLIHKIRTHKNPKI